MAISLHDLVEFTDNLLAIDRFSDYCPNGLQVQASDRVHKIVTGVTASQALIDRAITEKADVLMVHHGYFWKGEAQVIKGIKAKRIQALMQNNISLVAYHLPLDAHVQLGNNAQLAKVLDLQVTGGLDDSAYPIGLCGALEQTQTLAEFSVFIERRLQRAPWVLGDLSQPIKRVAWCTGAAQSYFEQAIAKGVDCFISGEISEQTYHLAQEYGVAYIAAGHHATERYGIKALGEHIQKALALDVLFVDINNPV